MNEIEKARNNELIEEMKKFFNASSLEEIAEKLGYKRTTATTWRSKGITDNAISRFKNLISEKKLALEQKPFPIEILDLIGDYEQLSDDEKEEYRLKIKRDAINAKLKKKGFDD